MTIQLTKEEKDYFRDNYSEVVTEGLGLFKKCNADVLRYINSILDPMSSTDSIFSRKTLLTLVAMNYAKRELTEEILGMRKDNKFVCHVNPTDTPEKRIKSAESIIKFLEQDDE